MPLDEQGVTRIAMWSGPRNVSTALMRSFGSRADTVVVDEPLYAYYLRATGLDHPGREAVLASQPQRWQDVARLLGEPLPEGATVQYQKQMTHHLLPAVGRDWLGGLRHAYLIRDPAHVVASYAAVRGEPTLEDLGFTQQVEIFRRFGGPVVDSADLLRDPRSTLTALCSALGLAFDETMLSWTPGPRATDGVWAPHWYAGVEASSGFGPYDPRPAAVPAHLRGLVSAATPGYEELAAHRLTGM
jgi:hypothetical protein